MGNKDSGTPKAALLKLDGTQMDRHGKVTETDFFKFLQLPADHMVDLEKTMTPSQALKFRNHVVKMKIGTSAAMPMKCGGPKCPNSDCPFFIEKNWPIASLCPLEANLIATWMKSYIDDLEIDIDMRTEMILANKLVECDMIDYRANIGLSVNEDAWTLLKVDITESDQGVSETTNVHPLLEAKEKAHRARLQILESFAATRRERYKKAQAMGQRDSDDIGSHFTRLKAAVEAAEGARKKKISVKDITEEDNIIDADWETPDK